jgi:hypothetical protein
MQGLITLCFITGLPTAVALFPQKGRLTPQQVEEEFASHTTKQGTMSRYFYYNKGL